MSKSRLKALIKEKKSTLEKTTPKITSAPRLRTRKRNDLTCEETMPKKLETVIHEIRKKSTDKITELNGQINELTKTRDDLQETLKSRDEKLEGLQVKLDEVAEQNRELEVSLDATAGALEQLQSDKTKLEAQLLAETQKNRELDKKLQSKELEKASSSEDHEKIKALKLENETLAKQLKEMKRRTEQTVSSESLSTNLLSQTMLVEQYTRQLELMMSQNTTLIQANTELTNKMLTTSDTKKD